MSATTERQTVTRIDIEHAIDAREDARGEHIRACRRGDPKQAIDHALKAYMAACLELQNLLDRWEDQLRGWEEGA
jgi:DNA-directed RNA polymerase subunit L